MSYNEFIRFAIGRCIMVIRLAGLLALLLTSGNASAQHFGGIGYRGGYNGNLDAPGYRGNLNNNGYRGGYSTFNSFGAPLVGYPYGYPYGGVTLGFGTGGYSYPAGPGAFPLTYGMGRSYGYSPMPAAPLRGSLLPAPSPAPAVASPSSDPAAAIVNLTVPDGAKVWFNDKETNAPGGRVAFTSPVLKPNESGTLNIKARWNDSTREMSLPLRAGDKMSVDLRNQ